MAVEEETVEEETDRRIDELVAALGDPEAYTFLLPVHEAVGADEGLWWMRHNLWEGYYVEHRIDTARKRVFFKIWEYGEEEPGWDEPVYLYGIDDE
jgi:hypothetical protein